MRVTESDLRCIVRRRLAEAASEGDLIFHVLWDVSKGPRIDVSPETPVWKKGMERWTPAGEVPEIRSALEGAPGASLAGGGLPASSDGPDLPASDFVQRDSLEGYIKKFLKDALAKGFKNDVMVSFDQIRGGTVGVWINEAPAGGGQESDTNKTLMPAMGGQEGMAKSVSRALGRLPASRDERGEFVWKLNRNENLMVRFLPGGGHRMSGNQDYNYAFTSLQEDGTRSDDMKLLPYREYMRRAGREMSARGGRQ